MVKAPVIGPDYIDFFPVGELIHFRKECPMEPQPLHFEEGRWGKSEIVISDAAATCWAKAWADSSIGKVKLTTDKV